MRSENLKEWLEEARNAEAEADMGEEEEAETTEELEEEGTKP